MIAPTERAEGEGSPPLMIGGGGTNETEEKLALRSALVSIAKPPLSVGEVGVETMVFNSHVVKWCANLDQESSNDFQCDREVDGGCCQLRSQWKVSPRCVDPMKGNGERR